MRHKYGGPLPLFLAGIGYPVIDHLGRTTDGHTVLYYTSDSYADRATCQNELDAFSKTRGFTYKIQRRSPYSESTIRIHLFPPEGWNARKRSSYTFTD